MLHLGDITKIDGTKVPAVEVIIGGSPCQNLSVAGNRKGLVGEQSQLFFEQIRIIKEMREKSARENEAVNAKPRYMVWENVPGAFSSNKGRDFKTVLEETIGVVTEVKPDIPIPKEGWHYSGCIMGEGFSLAWRVFDAQFWGIPQRRRRIALVADFGGFTAPEILFERESMSGNSAESGEERKGTAEDAERGVGETGIICLNDQGGFVMGVSENVTGALRAQEHGHQPAVCYGISSYESNAMKSANPNSGIYEADTSRTLDLNGGNPACNQGGIAVVFDASRRHNYEPFGDVCETVQAAYGTGVEREVVCVGNGQLAQAKLSDKVGALNCMHDQQAVITYSSSVGALCMDDYKGPNRQYVGQDKLQINGSVVRRLTPLECERLQGFPDGWTDIGDYTDTKGKKRKTSDTARYKALGNSIAIPPWLYVLSKLSLCCGEDHTMASLFDGIGGFPLIWEAVNGAGTCLWASEIDEFPMAVTRYHFNYD